jgi:hypothetical protein
MLTLPAVKAHLKLDPTDTSEDVLLGIYMAAALGAFKVESKRWWPEVGELEVVVVIDPATTPPTTKFVRYVDPAVLSEDEQALALAWLLLTTAHLYENRQNVVTDVRAVAVEVPQTATALMKLIREPTL